MDRNTMNTPARLLASALALFLGSQAAHSQELNKLNAAETAAGFKLLWDGTAAGRNTLLKGGVNGNATSNTWVIDDNGIKDPNPDDPANIRASDVFLYSKEQYDNFEWRLDFKVNAGGNSGLFIRTRSDWYCDGFEVGILDSRQGGDANERSNAGNKDILPAGILDYRTGSNFVAGTSAPIKRSGAIYDIYPTTKNGVPIPQGGVYVDMMKPANQWNSMVIWANGNYIETWLNGMKVTDFDLSSQDYLDRFHRSKFGNNNNQCGDDFGKLPSGYFAVQDHGGDLRVWLRNLKVRTFTNGAKLPAVLVTPNGGTFAGATKVTLDNGVTGAALRYTLDGSEPTESSPLYDTAGINVTKTSVLKVKAFRARFAASDVATANFTISGTGVRGPGTAAPEVVVGLRGKTLRLTNRNGLPFTAELISLDGRNLLSRTLSGGSADLPLAGLESGLYVVRMSSGQWLETRHVAIP